MFHVLIMVIVIRLANPLTETTSNLLGENNSPEKLLIYPLYPCVMFHTLSYLTRFLLILEFIGFLVKWLETPGIPQEFKLGLRCFT